MQIQNPTKTTMTTDQFAEFITREGFIPPQVIAVGLSVNDDKVELQYLKASDYPRQKLADKLEIPVVWTPGYAYLGNIQTNEAGVVVVEGEARFVTHPKMALCVKAFRTMLTKGRKPLADLYCATPTHKLETANGSWDSVRNFQHPDGIKMTNVRIVDRGIVAVQGSRIMYAAPTRNTAFPAKLESWTTIAEVNDRDPIIFLGRVTDDKVVATTELGTQFAVSLRDLTPQNPRALAGLPVKSEDFFYGMTVDGLKSTAYLTRREVTTGAKRLVLAPLTGQNAPKIAAQLQ